MLDSVSLIEGDREALLAQARRLVGFLEGGDDEQATQILSEFGAYHDSKLFQEIGRLTRELHEAINGVLLDDRLEEIVHMEMPDARARLTHVIEMTEDAANNTLNAVERLIPMVEQLTSGADTLAEGWQKFMARQMAVEDFRNLSKEMRDFLVGFAGEAAQIQSLLNSVLMAQGFQDLTGQIIRRVITLVSDIEKKLVQLLRISGERLKKVDPDVGQKTASLDAQGPAVPGTNHGDVVASQNDVDDLLSSLGF